MKIRLMLVAQWQLITATQTGLIITVTLLAMVLPPEQAYADRPFQRLRRRFDSIRPGWIIPHESAEVQKSGSSKEKQKKNSDVKQADSTSKTPELAPSRKDEHPIPTPDRVSQSLEAPNKGNDAIAERMSIAAPEEFGVQAEVSEESGAVVVAEIDSNGAASAAGLRRGDSIKNVGGVAIDSVQSLESITASLDQGVVVEFEIIRDGKELKKQVQFGTFQSTDMARDVTPTLPNPTKVENPESVSQSKTPGATDMHAAEIPTFESVLSSRPKSEPQVPSARLVEPLSNLLDLSTPALDKIEPEKLDSSVEGLLDFDVSDAK